MVVEVKSLERRCPTKHARDAAWKAVDAMAGSASIGACIDAWFAAYRAAGGVVKP